MALKDKLVNLEDLKIVHDETVELKSAMQFVVESTFLATEYRQGYLTTGGAYNTSSSGKSYAIDISACMETIFVKLQNNNQLRYGLYTKTISNVTSSDTANVYKALSSPYPHEIDFPLSVYSGYKTLIVTTDYNNANPASIFVYESTATKKDLADAIAVINADLGENIISGLDIVAGNITTAGVLESSTARIRTNDFVQPFAGVLTTSNFDGRFYVYAWEGATFKGGLTATGFVVNSSTGYTNIDFEYLHNKYPTYQFRIVYLINNGSATVSNISELKLTNILFPKASKASEKIRVMFNNVGKFNNGTTNKMSTADATAKMANYRDFYAQYQPNILGMEEFPLDSEPYIDSNDSVAPNESLYPMIFPYSTTPDQYAVVKSDFTIRKEVGIAKPIEEFYYGLRGSLAEIGTPGGRVIGVLSTVFDIGTHYAELEDREANRAAEMNAAIALLEPYDFGLILVDTNMESAEEYATMKATFEEAGYQVANGGFFLLTDTCPGADYKPIDNIFVKGAAKIKSFEAPDVLSTLASDHLPVVADVLFY